MREDLNKVLCESPRLGGLDFHWYRKEYEKYSDLYEDFEDDQPHNGDSSRGRVGIRSSKVYNRGRRRFNEHLAPLRGLIRKNVGRPWNKVYGELCEVFDKRSVINQHILLHLAQYVKTEDIEVREDGKLYWLNKSKYFSTTRDYGIKTYEERWELVKGNYYIEWYVDPRDGILKENKKRQSRRSQRKEWAKANKKKQLDQKRVYEGGIEISRADNGIWYKSVFKEFKGTWGIIKHQYYDYITKKTETVEREGWVYPPCRRYDGKVVTESRVQVEYKALNHKELKFYGVENRPVEATEQSNARTKRLERRLRNQTRKARR